MAIRSRRRRAALYFSSWSSAIGDPAGNLADNCEELGGMLPEVDALFTLVRQLANRSSVTGGGVPKWLVQRHGLGPLMARAGVAGYRDDLVRATLAWAVVEKELPDVVSALRDGGVRMATLKGAAYAKSLYLHPAERP